VALKACTVVVHDLNETAHAIDVTAETLYEAVAQALATVRAATGLLLRPIRRRCCTTTPGTI
jgi:hypothetical protein